MLDAEGKVAIAGAFNDPCDGAIFLFNADKITKEEIEAFARSDPYMTAGLIKEFSVCEYMGVVGSMLSKL